MPAKVKKKSVKKAVKTTKPAVKKANKKTIRVTVTKTKKSPVKAKIQAKKVIKPTKKIVSAKVIKPTKKIVSAKSKPAAAKVIKKPARKLVSIKKITAQKAKAKVKPIIIKKKKQEKVIQKPSIKFIEKAVKKPVKSNVTVMTDFVKEQTQKEFMSETATKSKVKKPKVQKAQVGQSNDLSMAGVRPYQSRPNEDYMNDAQRKHFHHILNQWKQELMRKVDGTVHHMQDEAANFPDPNDRATQEEEFSLELRTRDRERKLIKKIEEALLKIDQNEYGYCESCGIEIGVRRLEARPTATLCIDCKTLDEIKERQMGNV